tara:strand:+ start:5021 stop:5998 length:978 start_codon:yes stop_codon:yes gene_type:complete
MKVKLICHFCKSGFKRYKSAKKYKRDFCSYECFQKFRISQTKNHDFFCKIDEERKAYWFGFLYADGNISKKNRKQKNVTLELSIKDKEHVEKFANIFDSNCKIYSHNKNNVIYKSCKCLITSPQLWQDLYDKELVPVKTYKNNDEMFNFIPNDLLKHFIRGFFDGDGGIMFNKKTNGVSFHMVGTLKILQKIQSILCKELGISSTNIFPRKEVSNNIYVLAWAGIHQISLIGDYIYKDASIWLERKKEKIDKIKKKSVKKLLQGSSKYKGVSKGKYSYTSSIWHEKSSHFLGSFQNEIAAAEAYDKAVIKFKKPLYRLNFAENKI